jgi:hypothetical protein
MEEAARPADSVPHWADIAADVPVRTEGGHLAGNEEAHQLRTARSVHRLVDLDHIPAVQEVRIDVAVHGNRQDTGLRVDHNNRTGAEAETGHALPAEVEAGLRLALDALPTPA